MKKIFRKRRTVVVIALAVLLLVSYLVYSRPMTLSQLFPLRDIDQCIGISGYYSTSTQTDGIAQFTIEPGSEEFQELCGCSMRRHIAAVLGAFYPEVYAPIT